MLHSAGSETAEISRRKKEDFGFTRVHKEEKTGEIGQRIERIKVSFPWMEETSACLEEERT